MSARTDDGISLSGVLAIVGALLAMAMAINLLQSRAKTQTRVRADTAVGGSYEAHVFDAERLPALLASAGATLLTHRRLPVSSEPCRASSYAMPTGYDGPLLPVTPAAPLWAAHGPGGYRVPDGLIRWSDGAQTLLELKCISPWLTFDGLAPWARKMQRSFGSQACGYVRWAQATGGVIEYGFCGLAPRWSERILTDLQTRYRVRIRIREAFEADDFPPARRLRHAERRTYETPEDFDRSADL